MTDNITELPETPLPEPYYDFIRAKLRPKKTVGIVNPTLPECLFDWQQAVTAWALRRKTAALFEDCGLGKTLQQLAWAHAVKRHTNRSVIIYAPLGVTYQTADAGDTFGMPATIVKSQIGVRGPSVYVTNYQRLHLFDHSHFAGVVLDEGSILKNIAGKIRQQLTEFYRNHEWKLSCTATPAPNDPTEIGTQAEFLGIMNVDEMLSTFFINDQKITAGNKWRLKGHAVQPFYDWMASWSVYIRSPADLGFDATGYELPAHVVNVHEAEHKEFRRDGYLFKMDARTLKELRVVRKNSIDERMVLLEKIVRANGKKTPQLTWCGLNAESQAVAKELGAVEVCGSDSIDWKEEKLIGFARGQIPHLVTKPRQAGFGMNYQACHKNQHFGMNHSYEEFYQTSRRFHRFRQESEVTTDIVVTDVDRHVVDTVMAKEAATQKMANNLVQRMKRTMNDEIHGREVSVRGKRIKLATGNKWKCYNGDSILVVKDVPDDSIGYQIMSPPFPEVYTYSDSPFDMGNNNYEEFWHHWGMLIPEQLRVSAPGRLCTIHAWDLPILKRDAGYTGLRDFPGEIIRHFVAAGWIFHARQTIWKDPVVENARTHSLGHGNLLKDSAKSRLGICDYLLTFQKPGENQDPIAHSRLDLPVWRWQKWASGCLSQNDLTPQELRWLREVPEWMSAPIWYDIAPGDTLQKTTAREEQDEKHICPLQLTAIRRAILMWSRPGDVVASWFGGIGSEGFVAVKEERQALLVELKESYWKMAVSNLKRAETFKQQLTLADLK